MKKMLIILFLSLITTAGVNAQGMRMHGKMNSKAQERIDELEKIKLMEILNLDDDKMVKLLSRRREFKEKSRQLIKLKNEKLDRLQKAFNDEIKLEDKELKRLADELISIEEDMCRARLDYYHSLDGMLDSRQISRLMVFERNFQREIRDLIYKNRKGK